MVMSISVALRGEVGQHRMHMWEGAFCFFAEGKRDHGRTSGEQRRLPSGLCGGSKVLGDGKVRSGGTHQNRRKSQS